jgi:hypothetical protein
MQIDYDYCNNADNTFKIMLVRIQNFGLMLIVAIGLLSVSCTNPHQQMVQLLQQLNQRNTTSKNPFDSESNLAEIDSMIKVTLPAIDNEQWAKKARLELQLGHEQEAVNIYQQLLKQRDYMMINNFMPDMAIAYMRLGERNNCMLNHNGSSCIFPIKDGGIHKIQTGSKTAIGIYEQLLAKNPDDLASRWLLNIAYMTLGEYPQNVPAAYLIPGLNADDGTDKVKPFTDVAAGAGLDVTGRAGGVIVDDFDGDGYLDVITSAMDLKDHMHYFRNNGDGTFTDRTVGSGLEEMRGGLSIQQTDYNNDGRPDIFVLRGAWLRDGLGDEPSSLLRNNADGTFTDVTIPSGLKFMHPTQTAVWADFNNDGWLDVFVGMESKTGKKNNHPSALYINNHDGTFTNVTDKAHCNINDFIKGVTSADFNNDGWPDIFISTMSGKKYLLKNKCKGGNNVDFEDVTASAGITNRVGTFTTWFYDYNNDGWPDILVSGYNFDKQLGYYSAAAALGKPEPNAGNVFLYRNNHDGTFTDVTHEVGLDKVVYSMGGNFGDIDNDGYPDMYFGTGNPDFGSLVPNKLFRNIGGKRFDDVTTSSRTGNLQKGHGVAFADFRNNGIQDIFIKMGGAYIGDSYTSSLYLNPGQNNNNWICLKLKGVKANRLAIGSHIKVTFNENSVQRSVYKDVNSGGSFGSSPLRQEIGIGQAKVIDDIEIRWAGSNTVQHFHNVPPNQFLVITEGNNKLNVIHLKQLKFKMNTKSMPMPTMSGM